VRACIRGGVVAVSIALSACSLVGKPADEAVLQRDHAVKTAGMTQATLFRETLLVAVGAGAATQAVPGLHFLGLLADMGVVAYYFDELIYGTGAIAARDHHCPNLMAREDYWNILGAGLHNVTSSTEFQQAVDQADQLLDQSKNSQLFAHAIQQYNPSSMGLQLAGWTGAKLGAQALLGIFPWIGPTVAAGINGYIFYRLNKTAMAYYDAKALFVCQVPVVTNLVPAPKYVAKNTRRNGRTLR